MTESPLILSFSQQARLGELAMWRDRIRKRMRLGWFRPGHCKSVLAQETRALLTARKLVQGKLHDVEMSLRGILRGFGLKVGRTTPRLFASAYAPLRGRRCGGIEPQDPYRRKHRGDRVPG